MKRTSVVPDHLIDQARKIEQVLTKLPGMLFASAHVDAQERFDVFVGRSDKITDDIVTLAVNSFCKSLVSNKASFTVSSRRGVACKKD